MQPTAQENPARPGDTAHSATTSKLAEALRRSCLALSGTSSTIILAVGLLVAGCGGSAELCDDDERLDAWIDVDGDGFGSGPTLLVCSHSAQLVAQGGDCDDGDVTVSPFGDETCNGIDDDCDGRIDERFAVVPYYPDDDGDGFGSSTADAVFACARPDGHVRNLLDCDDDTTEISPDAVEVCNEVDDNCDGLVDEDDPSLDPALLSAWYADADADGFGDPDIEVLACTPPSYMINNADDCDDTRAAVNPDQPEVCNGADDNCDTLADDDDPALDTTTATEWFFDGDEDGLGDPAVSVVSCLPPATDDHVPNDQDCDDSDPTVMFPRNWLEDYDMDGFGAGPVVVNQCDWPGPGHAPPVVGTDCNDTDDQVFPGQLEVCDGVDQDCDGLVDDDDPDLDPTTASPFFADTDGDGFGDATQVVFACFDGPFLSLDDTDCDDTDGDVNPDQVEVCNGVDDDCDALTDDDDTFVDPNTLEIWYLDSDDDGYGDLLASVATCEPPAGYVDDPTDCDDTDADSGAPGLWFDDIDGDGVGAGLAVGPACSGPAPTWVRSVGAEDCDDDDIDRYPGAPEICGDGIDQDCNGVDFCPLFDDFEGTGLDLTVWESFVGFGSLTNAYSVSGSRSANLSGGGAVLTSVVVDTSDCTGVTWSYMGQRGPEDPDPNDFLYVEWFDGTAWLVGDAWEGISQDDNGFSPRSGDIVHPGVPHAAFQLRLRSEGNSTGNDDYFIDDVAIDCF